MCRAERTKATAADWHGKGDDVLVCGDTIIDRDRHGECVEVDGGIKTQRTPDERPARAFAFQYFGGRPSGLNAIA